MGINVLGSLILSSKGSKDMITTPNGEQHGHSGIVLPRAENGAFRLHQQRAPSRPAIICSLPPFRFSNKTAISLPSMFIGLLCGHALTRRDRWRFLRPALV